MTDFLGKILASTAAELEQRKSRVPPRELQEQARERPGAAVDRKRFSGALSTDGVSLIAEFKRASPSKGDIRPDADIAPIVKIYEGAGAAAVSVLTEEKHFGGSLDDLRRARGACGLPLLRKDFIIDDYQLLEAVVAGADAVLLIVAALADEQLAELMAAAADRELECLVEVHNRDELERALAADAPIIGINNRDLRTFAVDLGTSLNLIKFIPEDVIVVSESGISGRGDVSRLVMSGVDAILVGETLMRSADPGGKISELVSSGNL